MCEEGTGLSTALPASEVALPLQESPAVNHSCALQTLQRPAATGGAWTGEGGGDPGPAPWQGPRRSQTPQASPSSSILLPARGRGREEGPESGEAPMGGSRLTAGKATWKSPGEGTK